MAGAVDACAVSDNVFSAGLDEEEVVGTLNEVERTVAPYTSPILLWNLGSRSRPSAESWLC